MAKAQISLAFTQTLRRARAPPVQLIPYRLYVRFPSPGQGDRRALPMVVFVSPGGRSSPGPPRGRQSPGAVPSSAPSAGTRTKALTSPQQAPRGGRCLVDLLASAPNAQEWWDPAADEVRNPLGMPGRKEARAAGGTQEAPAHPIHCPHGQHGDFTPAAPWTLVHSHRTFAKTSISVCWHASNKYSDMFVPSDG